MANSNNLTVKDKSFETAFSKLDSVCETFNALKVNFAFMNADLLDGWEGKAFESAEKVMKSLERGFENCVSDLECVKSTLQASYSDLQDSDRQIADAIEMKK